jgi:uroporphyrinogen-III decarboxylase
MHRYEEANDVIFTVADNIAEGGVGELERYVALLESRSPDPGEAMLDGIEAARLAVESEPARRGDLFVIVHADVCFPAFEPYLTLFLETMATRPALADRYMEATTEGVVRCLRRQLELGADGCIAANDWCFNKGPLFSPAMFRRFFVPHLRRLADLCHDKGAPFFKHLDGNVMPLLPILVEEVGIDGLHAIEPTAGMDIARLKREWGDRIVLLGNIDCGDVLTNGPPERIRSEVRRIVREASPGGGHIFSSSNAIHGGVPLEHVEAMLAAAREFGRYPIR